MIKAKKKKFSVRWLVLSIVQWVFGLLGVGGIFDMFMRLSRKSPWMLMHPSVIAVDGVLLFLFIFSLFLPRLTGDGRFKKI